jgi:hypothetical protein
MVAITKIHYSDILQAEALERAKLADRLAQLAKIERSRGMLSAAERDEQKRLEAIQNIVNDPKNKELCDPLFVTVRDLFNASPGLLGSYLGNHDEHGILIGAVATPGSGSFTVEACTKTALTHGLLSIDGGEIVAPPVIVQSITKQPQSDSKPETADLTQKQSAAKQDAAKAQPPMFQIVADTQASGYAQLSKMFFAAVGEAVSMQALALMVLPMLAIEGDPRAGDSTQGTVDTAEFARLMRKLVADGVTADIKQLRRSVNEALDSIQNRGSNLPVTELGIDLPNLEQSVQSDIVPDHCRLMGVFICGAMFEELKVFEVVDKLAELYQHGMLAISTGNAGKQLYRYWKDAPNRMSAAERQNFYAITMGVPGGEANGMINREFNDLWLRFVSSVSSFIRQNEVDKLLRASLPSPISHQQVRKAARDLAANLSAHGYGMAFYAALDLQTQIKFMINLLGDADIRANYGAKDIWQVVDQVATLELGGAKTSNRYRTLATCGAIITAWLAENAVKIGSPGGPLIDINEVRSPLNPNNPHATTKPTDFDLVNACELWLADTATNDSVIDQMAQPREAPVMTSRPVQIPAIAREMLADLPGVGLGLGMGMNTRH